jgi:hypothetical protein
MRPRHHEARLDIRIDRTLKARLIESAQQQHMPLAKLIRRFLLAGLASQQPAEQ